MSGLDESNMPVTNEAATIEERAAIWLQRQHFWDWSDSDQETLDAWLAEATAHEVAYLRLKAGYGRTERLVALRTRRMTGATRARLFRFTAGAAGVLVLAAAGFAAQFYLTQSQDVTYTTPVGGHQTIALADGSQIELNTDTVLRVRVNAGQRTATLEHGEAYFQIKHDAAHPFVVAAAGHRVTDLGTKFLVRGGPSRIEVTLVEGRARIDADDAALQSHSAILTPGDDFVAGPRSISVTRETAREESNKLSWRSGSIVFRHTALSDAAEEFNRYNRDKIIIADDAAGKLKVDGTLPTNDPEAFADIAQDILHLHVEKRGSDFVISR
jgi:transmembrane sensor